MRCNCTFYPPSEAINLFRKVDDEEEEGDDAITRQKGRRPIPSVFLRRRASTQCVPMGEMMAKPGVEPRGVGSPAMCLLYNMYSIHVYICILYMQCNAVVLLLQYITSAI